MFMWIYKMHFYSHTKDHSLNLLPELLPVIGKRLLSGCCTLFIYFSEIACPMLVSEAEHDNRLTIMAFSPFLSTLHIF